MAAYNFNRYNVVQLGAFELVPALQVNNYVAVPPLPSPHLSDLSP